MRDDGTYMITADLHTRDLIKKLELHPSLSALTEALLQWERDGIKVAMIFMERQA